jgi:hypothetical protein
VLEVRLCMLPLIDEFNMHMRAQIDFISLSAVSNTYPYTGSTPLGKMLLKVRASYVVIVDGAR